VQEKSRRCRHSPPLLSRPTRSGSGSGDMATARGTEQSSAAALPTAQ
jgi:hypothetical protein